MLKDFHLLITELQAENSSNGKKEILKRYPQCQELLMWTLNPYKKFGVTSDQLKKYKDLVDTDLPGNILDLLHSLVNRVSTGHKAIAVINNYIRNNQQYEDIIYRIIDKDLRCRCGATLINKVYPGLIPEFDVALAKDYHKEKVDLNAKWYWSRKLDGVRCITRIENGQVTFYSRKGHEFDTLDIVKQAIKSINVDNCVLDGEICLVDVNGADNFQNVMKEIRKKDHTIEKPHYLIFDCLTLEEFDNRVGEVPLSKRYDRLQKLNPQSWLVSFPLAVITQNEIDSVTPKQDIVTRLNYAQSKQWEGIILRKDVGYEGKRSKNMLKVKKMHDAEYKVIAINIGLIDDGQGNKVEGLTSVDIRHKENRVKVGSGWTYEQRINFKNHPNEIIDEIITVQYFEETTNKEGKHSLRFPIMKHIHGDKREM